MGESVMAFDSGNGGAARPRHPAGLSILFFTEMWERFSFYLMLGILDQYLSDSQKGGMGWSNKEAHVVVGSYIGLVYFTPFIGGLIADRLLGCRKTIIIGGVLMMIGHLVLAWPTELGLYLGLSFLIMGNGAFKPNISTLVGNLYPPGSPLKDTGYNIFYMGINLGAFICNFVASFVRNYVDEHPLHITSEWTVGGWHAAFATAAVGMLIGLTIFSINYGRLADADRRTGTNQGVQESLMPLWIQCLIPAIAIGAFFWFVPNILDYLRQQYPDVPVLGIEKPTLAFIGACIPVIVFYLRIWRQVPDPADRGRVAGLLVIFGVVIVFWMTFMLTTTALNVWIRDDTNRQPNAVVRLVTDRRSEFAENAPPSYFFNAGPEVPRPSRATFEIVSSAEYEKLKESHKLRVAEGQKVAVTKEMFDKVFAHTTAETPILEPGKQVKLVNTELFQSINAGYIILLTPVVVWFFGVLRRRRLEPSTPAKIGLGMILDAGGPLIMLGATLVTKDGAIKAAPAWLFAQYLAVTLGELCLSPMGLSLVNKMAPARISAFMMGGWFVSTSLGNKLSGIFGELYETMDHRHFWIILTASNLLFGGLVFLLLPWLTRQMAGKKDTP
jgi:POT family proton-dependent oligopeptide transporter